jgi:hypothetical protein
MIDYFIVMLFRYADAISRFRHYAAGLADIAFSFAAG